MKEILENIQEYLKNPYYIALLAIIGAAAFLRFRYAFFEGIWVDEGRYARLGFEISEHLLDYSTIDSWRGQVTSFPPVYPYLIALSTYIFGKTDFAVRTVSPLMGVLGTGLTYFLGREVKNREVGLIAAALVALNPVFWFLSERILVGATFAALYTASILALYYGLENREYSKYALWVLGPAVALAIMTKQPAYTLGIIVPVYFVHKKRKEIKEILIDRVSFKKSVFYQETLKDRNYYIGIGLGLLTLAPWMLRNMAVCSFPLCGLSRAAKFANTTSPPAWASAQGPFFFITNLPAVVTISVSALIAVRVIQYLLRQVDMDADRVVKYSAATLGLLAVAYSVTPKLVPMVLLSSIALYATNDAEKLLWLSIGVGIGFMSIPAIKVPRYIVFVVPMLVTIGAISLYSISDWLSKQLEIDSLNAIRVAAVVLLPLVFLSYSQGVTNISQGGYGQLEPAGNWIDENAPENSDVAGSSPTQLRYYVYPRMSYRLPGERGELRSFIRKKNISYIEIDIYERAQPQWAQTGIPPYRLPVSTVRDLRSGKTSPQQVLSSYGQAPDYLEPVKEFGSTQIPIMQQKQPMVIVYRVNQSEL